LFKKFQISTHGQTGFLPQHNENIPDAVTKSIELVPRCDSHTKSY